MKINSELILILSMVVLLATSGIVSQLPVAFVFAEDGDDGGDDEGNSRDERSRSTWANVRTSSIPLLRYQFFLFIVERF